MKRVWHRLIHREEGAALLLALVFLVILGIFVPALLAMADSNIRFFAVAKGTDNRVFAADYGIEYGIKELESSVTNCLNTAAGTQALPDPPALNGRVVHVECQTTEGTGTGGPLLGYALITTDTSRNTTVNPSLITQSGNQPLRIVGGAVYLAGEFDSQPLNPQLQVEGGNVEQRYASCAGVTKNAGLVVTPSPPFDWSCIPGGSPPNPTVDLPPSPPAAFATPTDSYRDILVGLKTCRVFYPGTYAFEPPTLATSATVAGNYFASGIYYFNNVGLWDPPLRTDMFAGEPDLSRETYSPDVIAAGKTPCATDLLAEVSRPGWDVIGKGAEWILGGNSAIYFGNQVTLEVFSRYAGATPEGTDGVSLYTVKTTASGWTAWNNSASTYSIEIPSSSNNTIMTFHGATYSYNAPIWAFATNDTVAQFAGGVAASYISLKASNSASGLVISVPASIGPRLVRIRATAEGVNGEASVSYQAVVRLVPSVGGTFTSTIQSWRRI